MKLSNLQAAIAEAERFLAKAKSLSNSHDPDGEPFPRAHIPGSKHTAAVRRASMDLTRALATLRNDRF